MFGVWESLYLGLFVFGSGFLLIQLLLGNFGDAEIEGDLEADFDAELEVEGDFDAELDADATDGAQAQSGVSFLTPLIIAPTLAGLGAVGLFASLLLGWPWLLHLPVAIVGGVAMGYALFYFLARIIAPMQGSSEVRMGSLWGTVGEVITPIPENRIGEIRFVARGSYLSAPARSVTGEMIPRGETVMIEKVVDSVVFVRPTQ